MATPGRRRINTRLDMRDNPHRREYEKTKLGRWYYQRRPEVHLAEIITIVMLLFGAAGTWVTQSNAVETNRKTNEIQDAHLEKIDTILSEQKAISARIEQKIDYVREDMKAVVRKSRRENGEDER